MKYTTANIDSVFYLQLKTASKQFGHTEMKIFKDLINMTVYAAKCGLISDKLTEYQNHHPESWKTLYYSLTAEEIECFTKSRQKFKISISKLAFIGFLLFWRLLLLKYSEKLYSVEIDFNSYKKYSDKFTDLIIYFKNRLEIIQKE